MFSSSTASSTGSGLQYKINHNRGPQNKTSPAEAMLGFTAALQLQQDCWGPTVTNSVRKQAEESVKRFIPEERVEAELATSSEADSVSKTQAKEFAEILVTILKLTFGCMEQEGEWADNSQIIEAMLIADSEACRAYFEKNFESGEKRFGVGKGPGLVEQPPQHITCIPVRGVKQHNEDGENEWKHEEVEDPGWAVETLDPYGNELLAMLKEKSRRRTGAVPQSSSSCQASNARVAQGTLEAKAEQENDVILCQLTELKEARAGGSSSRQSLDLRAVPVITEQQLSPDQNDDVPLEKVERRRKKAKGHEAVEALKDAAFFIPDDQDRHRLLRDFCKEQSHMTVREFAETCKEEEQMDVNCNSEELVDAHLMWWEDEEWMTVTEKHKLGREIKVEQHLMDLASLLHAVRKNHSNYAKEYTNKLMIPQQDD
eukprot:3002998-Rhodomonas_salina.1